MNKSKVAYTAASLFLMLAYSQLFFSQESLRVEKEVKLMPTMPVQVFQVLGHTYMEQIFADMLFIKVAVFYGGGNNVGANVESLANHFVTMQKLNPKMIDFYHRTESALADKDEKYVRITNKILASGRSVLPDEVILPYFEGFNYFYYLDEPIKAAALLRIASTYDDKFQWLGHLASTLLAKGGSIRAGLAWLKGMYVSMEEGDEKNRYARDIQDFEKALVVEGALNSFEKEYGEYPDSLAELEKSGFKLPILSDQFDYLYQKPNISLRKKDSVISYE